MGTAIWYYLVIRLTAYPYAALMHAPYNILSYYEFLPGQLRTTCKR